jgi:hypothetical protein
MIWRALWLGDGRAKVAPRPLTCCDVLARRCQLEQRRLTAASRGRKAEERGRHERKRGVVPWPARVGEDKDAVLRTWIA